MSIPPSKTPIKAPLTPNSKMHKANTNNCSKYKQQSQSKIVQSQLRQITQSQPYKNILNKLLRSQNLIKFLNEASKYVNFTEEIVQKLKPDDKQYEQIRQESRSFGRALMKDGSFIRCYCKLVEKYFPERKHEIREIFFENYRHIVSIREKMFFQYFKGENLENELSNTCSPMKSKSNIKGVKSAINKKKCLSQCEEDIIYKQQSKDISNLTTIERNVLDHQPSEVLAPEDHQEETVSQFNKYISQRKKFNNQCNSMPISKSKEKEKSKKKSELKKQQEIKASPKISPRFKKLETEEERDYRLSGLAAADKSPKRKRNIIKFQEDLKNNPRLQEIYNSILKQKQEYEQREKKRATQRQGAVLRSSVKPERIRVLDERQRSFLDEQQLEILDLYPNLTLKANYPSSHLQVIYYKILGYYKNYLIKKAIVCDKNHIKQRKYDAIIAQKDTDRSIDPQGQDYKFQKNISVNLFLS